MAWAGALPPFSFCAAIISCLLRSASSIAFFFSRASASLFSASSLRIFSSSALFCAASFFLLLYSDLFPLGLLLLQPCQFLLFLGSFFPPRMDVFFQLVIQFTLLGLVLGRSHDVKPLSSFQ